MRRVFFKRRSHAVAAVDVLCHTLEHFRGRLVLRLCRDHFQTADDGQTRRQNDGKLRAQHRQLLLLDAQPFLRAALAVGILHFLDTRDQIVGFSELGYRFKFIIGFDDPGSLDAIRRNALVSESFQPRSPVSFCFRLFSVYMLTCPDADKKKDAISYMKCTVQLAAI